MDAPSLASPAALRKTPDAEVRPLSTDDDFAACEDMQRRVWGRNYACVPGALMKVSLHVGGIVAGAFDEGGTMLGFVFGLTGPVDGRIVHWSHMLAVDPPHRDRGIGSLLKRHQLVRARELGAERVEWTFDPLVARNAHLNINRLGVDVRAYVPDMYSGTGSDLHVFGTDRFIVSLSTASRRAPRAQPADDAVANAPFLNGAPGSSTDAAPSGACVRIRIPADITEVAACDPAAARAWRASTRAAFTRALAQGYRIVQVRTDGDDPAYVLVRSS